MIRPVLTPIITPDKMAMTVQSLLVFGQLIVIIGFVWLMLKVLKNDGIKSDTAVCLLMIAGVGLLLVFRSHWSKN